LNALGWLTMVDAGFCWHGLQAALPYRTQQRREDGDMLASDGLTPSPRLAGLPVIEKHHWI
jgi:hypothetical protein